MEPSSTIPQWGEGQRSSGRPLRAGVKSVPAGTSSTLASIPDPRARLEAAISVFVSSLEEESWGAIVVHAWAEADRNPRVRDLLQRMFDQERGFAAMFIREAIARGEASPDLNVEGVSLATGIGGTPKDPVLTTWKEHLADWMKGRGLLKK